ncbi:MAG: hypothetical protein WAV07_17950 [Candidatus Contendobacter sp.]
MNDEASYQRLFERHPVIFSTLGLDLAVSFEQGSPNSIPFDSDRNFQPEPDFLGAESHTGNVVVVELKTPFVGDITTARQDGNRAKFKALAESYISQATEYAESIRGREEARAVVKPILKLTKIGGYRVLIIYALAEENDPVLISSLLMQRKIETKIVFYDELLDRMTESYSSGRTDFESRPGFCFVSHISFAPTQPLRRVYLAEYGNSHTDRISVYLEDGVLVYECIDAQQRRHYLQSKISGMGPHYVRFEFTNDVLGTYMSLNVDNVESDLRLGKNVSNLSANLSVFTIGANSSGAEGAWFYLFEHYIIDRTMKMAEKLGSFKYFQDKLASSSRCLEFSPHSYMIADSSGNLIQENAALRPVLRDWR